MGQRQKSGSVTAKQGGTNAIHPVDHQFCSLVVAILSLAHTTTKDRTSEIREDSEKFDGIEKSLLKANIKLDTVCNTTTETRADIKSLNTDIKNMDTRVVVLERDMKTAFNAISELKRKISHED